MVETESAGMPTGRSASRAGRRVADVLATAAMGSWVVLAMMPVLVALVALT